MLPSCLEISLLCLSELQERSRCWFRLCWWWHRFPLNRQLQLSILHAAMKIGAERRNVLPINNQPKPGKREGECLLMRCKIYIRDSKLRVCLARRLGVRTMLIFSMHSQHKHCAIRLRPASKTHRKSCTRKGSREVASSRVAYSTHRRQVVMVVPHYRPVDLILRHKRNTPPLQCQCPYTS